MQTMDNRAVDEDPFVDPVHPHPHPHLEQRRRPDEDSTLIAGRTASLTLGTDSLIVLGMDHDLGTRLQRLTEGPVRRGICTEAEMELLWLATERYE